MTKDINNNIDFKLASSQLFPMLTFPKSSFELIGDDRAIRLAQDGLEAFDKSDFENAIDIYSRAIEEFPNTPFFYACRHIASISADEVEEAFFDLSKLLKLDRNYCEYITYVFSNANDFLYGEPEDLPDYSSLEELLKICDGYSSSGQWGKGIELYNEGIQRFGHLPILMRERALLYIRTLQYNLAYNDLIKVVDLITEDGHAFLYLGMIYEAVKEDQRALELYDKAIAKKSNHFKFFEQRALLHTARREWRAAIEDYSRCIELEEGNSDFYLDRSFLYEEMGDFLNALNDANSAVELEPSNPDIYIHRSELKNALDDFEGAENDRRIAERLSSVCNQNDLDSPDSIDGWDDGYSIR